MTDREFVEELIKEIYNLGTADDCDLIYHEKDGRYGIKCINKKTSETDTVYIGKSQKEIWENGNTKEKEDIVIGSMLFFPIQCSEDSYRESPGFEELKKHVIPVIFNTKLYGKFVADRDKLSARIDDETVIRLYYDNGKETYPITDRMVFGNIDAIIELVEAADNNVDDNVTIIYTEDESGRMKLVREYDDNLPASA